MQLIRECNINCRDVFLDIGCGIGIPCLQVRHRVKCGIHAARRTAPGTTVSSRPGNRTL